MRLTPFIIFLLSCGQSTDTAENGIPSDSGAFAGSANQNALSQSMVQAATRWRGLKLADVAFTGFGKLPGDGLRVNTGTFVAELPRDGKLHLLHGHTGAEISVDLSAVGRDGEGYRPQFEKATLGACIKDAIGVDKLKSPYRKAKPRTDCLRQAEQQADGITAWWRGGLDAFEQGWIIDDRPNGHGSLSLTVAFTGAEIRTLEQDQVALTDTKGSTWTYDGLNAWDANQQRLDVWFEPGAEGEVVIMVDDSEAQYPITIDPWFSTAGIEVVNSLSLSDGTVISGSGLTSSNYQPTNGQSWSSFSANGSMNWELTNEVSASSITCPYGSVSGSWNNYAWSGNGTEDYVNYRCGDLGGQGQFDWSPVNTGSLTEAFFGQQVHPLADTNNDGYGDILVTAPNWSASSYSNRGRIFIFRGSVSGLETSPISTMVGQSDDEHFGDNVLTGEDINDDGYDDIVVAASQSDANGTDSGILYMYFGSAAGISTSAAGTVTGNEADATFGAVMDWAGDVNGDGYADLVIGNRNNDTTGTNMGAAYIYYGSAGGFGSAPSVVWYGSPTVYSASSAYDYDYFGYDVAGIGDIDGDGYDDVAVSAPYHDSNGADAGKVYIYLGSANGISATADYARYGSDSDYFGMDIKKVGDINGDGYAELYVDSYVWLGNANGISGFYDTTLNVDRAVGDIDGDGYDDVMYNNALCFGDSNATLGCDSARSNAVIVADITGDGFYDYISADPSYDSNKGRIYTYLAFEPDIDLDGYLASEDCNDEDATINPSASEICDEVDNDCDGLIDDDDTVDTTSGTIFYADADGDGYGDLASTVQTCSVPTNYVENSDDCDDTTALARPGGTELPGDGVDQDCDGGDLCFADYDADGFRSVGGTTMASMDLDCSDPGEASSSIPATDCDDLNPSINPSATEVPDNGVDEDCNGGEECYADADDDGYRSSNGGTVPSNDMDCLDAGEGATSEPATDCDDGDAAIHPGVNDVVGDGIDQDCDGGDLCYADADDDGYRVIGGLTIVSNDLDCLDAGEASSNEPATDCDDNDLLINPGVAEIPGDEFDQNCDGSETCFADADNDGYRDQAGLIVDSVDIDCQDSGEALTSMLAADCDDADGAINPLATEITGDGIDQNCDGQEMCFIDADNDNYRVTGTATLVSSDADCDDPGEGHINEPDTDCDDNNPAINPGAQEIIVDGIDQDCDGGDACYADIDGDGQRDTSNSTILSADNDCLDAGEADINAPATDCDDNDALIYSGAPEGIDDGVDSDCDGEELCYVDADGDGQRANNNNTVGSDDLDCLDAGEAPAGGSGTDCDDNDAAVYFGATESIGDGVDQDCDGAELCYADADGDSHVAMNGSTVASSDLDCFDAGEGLYSDPMDDCDDTDANIYPGAAEITDDGIDGDCDGGEECYADLDNDGFREMTGGLVVSVDLDCLDSGEGRIIDPATDCDDNDAAVNPIAAEIPADSIDQNCDQLETCYVDADNDGYRELTGSTVTSADMDCDDVGEGSDIEPATDCDDNDAYSYPGATEVIADGADQNCDGGDTCYIDADDDNYRADSSMTVPSSDLDCTDAGEASNSAQVDCNDAAANVYPGAPETIDNGVDEDCDGGESCYVDFDSDGYRETTNATILSSDMDCTDPGEGSSVEPATDCDDTNGAVNPGAIELPSDSLDSNCDGAETCYVDYDNDGYRELGSNTISSIDADCDDPGEGSNSEPATDCNDSDSNVYPLANEIVADGIDQDCNGGDMCYIDADNDGSRGSDMATLISADLDCSDFGEADSSVDSSDCDDNDATINVNAEERVADGVDQDCDGVELCFVDYDSDGYREIGEDTVLSSDMDCDDAGEGTAEESATDCDDTVPSTYPGATELIGDGVDQDCDGTEVCYTDADGDGYRTLDTILSSDTDCEDAGEAAETVPLIDCNDVVSAINPGMEEIPDDGVDQNCDGADEIIEEPSIEEPSTEDPSTEVEVTGTEDSEAEKSGCSTSSIDTLGWIVFGPLMMLVGRRRRLTAAE